MSEQLKAEPGPLTADEITALIPEAVNLDSDASGKLADGIRQRVEARESALRLALSAAQAESERVKAELAAAAVALESYSGEGVLHDEQIRELILRCSSLRDDLDAARSQLARLEAERDAAGKRVAELEDGHVRLVCESMNTWRHCIEEEHHGNPRWAGSIEAIRLVFTLIRKSSLLYRLIYARETLRTEKCPEHKGKWSGLEHPDNPCPHGCQMTGWLRAAAAEENATPRASGEEAEA